MSDSQCCAQALGFHLSSRSVLAISSPFIVSLRMVWVVVLAITLVKLCVLLIFKHPMVSAEGFATSEPSLLV